MAEDHAANLCLYSFQMNLAVVVARPCRMMTARSYDRLDHPRPGPVTLMGLHVALDHTDVSLSLLELDHALLLLQSSPVHGYHQTAAGLVLQT